MRSEEKKKLGGGGFINSQLETHQSLSTAAYSVNIRYKLEK